MPDRAKHSLVLLSAGEMPERYKRNLGTIGIAGQKKLLNSKVAVIGAGGLGGTVVELLARSGVGFLRVIDGDIFAVHNWNRQLFADEGNLGVNKAQAAAKRVEAINSDVCIEAATCMLNEENAETLLEGMDVIVDALDNIKTRLLVNNIAQKFKMPLVHAAVAGFTGQVFTAMPGHKGLDYIYKNVLQTNKGIEVSVGNPAATPALAASLQVQETIKILTGIGQPLCDKMLYFDTEFNIFEVLTI